MLLAAAGCGSGAANHAPPSDVSAFGAPAVSLTAAARGHTHVVGGTPGMRARARAILNGMGDSAIAEVRFGRPSGWFSHPRRRGGPVWLSTTVVADGSPFVFVTHALTVPAGGKAALVHFVVQVGDAAGGPTVAGVPAATEAECAAIVAGYPLPNTPMGADYQTYFEPDLRALVANF
jgi:hypothetical protein